MAKGYKQTEVGVIPEEWEVKALGELIASAQYGSSEKSSTSGKVPVLRMGNLQGGKIDWNNLVFTSNEREIETYVLNCDDLLFNRTNTIDLVGKTSIYKAEFPAIYAGYLIRIVTLKNVVNSDFLNFFLNTQSAKRYSQIVLSIAVGQANINAEKLKTYPIPLPPLPEQKAIAQVLSDTDALIASLDKLIAKKKAIKQGAMQELLTGRRRIGSKCRVMSDECRVGSDGIPEGYKQTEVGVIPEEWEVKGLGEVATIKTGSKNNQDKVEDGEYPFFVRSETIQRLNTYSYDCEAILIPGEGGIGSIFHYIEGKFEAHQRVYVIRNFAECYGKFIYLQMKLRFGAHAMENSVKATVDSLRLPTFECFPVLLPPLPEQKAIAQVLSDMDSEIAELEERREKSKALKQGLMQVLLTGKVRLV